MKKDTKYVDVHSMLKAAGKTMFITFYDELKDFSLSDKYLCYVKKFIKKVLQQNLQISAIKFQELERYSELTNKSKL